MPAQVPGYEYDIFISYRQNDNKAISGSQVTEGWVTEFVNNLSVELEATVKGRLSIYFDKNPKHGLGETHNVDESLAGKLRSLILIPIISQTYCDTESFAWRQEFVPFLDLAAKDQFGLNIKLLSGNVASRVLPIRIHELDADDVQLFEGTLKGKMRSIDFIFKSAGVNRPLRTHEEDPLKNLNQTLYRDQINKAAIAIKDIINGLKGNRPEHSKPEKLSAPVSGKMVMNTKSIAVLPLAVESADENYLGEGIAEEFIRALGLIKGLRIATRHASFQFKANHPVADVCQTLNVNTVVSGKIKVKPDGSAFSFKATDHHGNSIWEHTASLDSETLTSLRQAALSLMTKLDHVLRDFERNELEKKIKVPVHAYESLLLGRHLLRKGAISVLESVKHFKQATEHAPEFAPAWSGYAQALILAGFHQLIPFVECSARATQACLKSLELQPVQMEAFHALAFLCMADEWGWPDIEPVFDRVFTLNVTQPAALPRFKHAITKIKAQLDESENVGTIRSIPHYLPAYFYLHRGEFQQALKHATVAVKQDDQSFMAQRALGLSYLGLEQFSAAIESLETANRLSNGHTVLLLELMGAYTLAGRREESMAILDETLASRGQTAALIYAHFFHP